MIVGIGCDIAEHSLTKSLKWHSDSNVLRRILSAKEILLYNKQKKVRFIAGRFAAKEAVLKCLGTGMQDGIDLTEIEILQLKLGAPQVSLKGKVKKLSDKLKVKHWHITISHSSKSSFAVAVAEK